MCWSLCGPAVRWRRGGEASRAELDVVLLERDAELGRRSVAPKGRRRGLREFADPTGSWAARKITRVVFVAPDDTE